MSEELKVIENIKEVNAEALEEVSAMGQGKEEESE